MEIQTKKLNKMVKFKSFYVSKSEFDFDSEFKNFIDNAILHSKVVNGFRIIPVELYSGICWFIIPNNSHRSFYFTKLSLAEEFCHKYSNYHSDAYWYRLWVKNPLFHRLNVIKIVDSISYML